MDKGRGRTIVRPVVVNGVALQVGDRLDPSEHLIDPAGLASIELPATVVLWRPGYSEGGLPTDCVTHRT
eukprot:5542803-Pyramimonas_sp.AAC.1